MDKFKTLLDIFDISTFQHKDLYSRKNIKPKSTNKTCKTCSVLDKQGYCFVLKTYVKPKRKGCGEHKLRTNYERY